MNLRAKTWRCLHLALMLLSASISLAATEEEARALVLASNETLSFIAQPEIRAQMMDADARIAFNRLLDNRRLRAADPEWRSYYSSFQKDYTAAAVQALPPMASSNPHRDMVLKEAVMKELSSSEARELRNLLESSEFRAAAADSDVQFAWVWVHTVMARFREDEMRLIYRQEELQKFDRVFKTLAARYPVAFPTLVFGEGQAFKRFRSIVGSLPIPEEKSPTLEERKTVIARMAVAVQPVIVKWKPIVEGKMLTTESDSPRSQAGNDGRPNPAVQGTLRDKAAQRP